METRKITIVSTKTQKKSVIMSAATTLAELKSDLTQNGIDYDGMTFYEGVSKVELKNDTSVLPHDVPYKGQTTNELVFMLTNTNKKIKSGADMSRSEVYNKIKEFGLQEECERRFGQNFTRCKTSDLVALVDSYTAYMTACSENECVDIKARTAVSELLDVLKNCLIINIDSVKRIKDIIFGRNNEKCEPENCEDSFESSYSDKEIDNMFDFIE